MILVYNSPQEDLRNIFALFLTVNNHYGTTLFSFFLSGDVEDRKQNDNMLRMME
jgi:hypothetical protein